MRIYLLTVHFLCLLGYLEASAQPTGYYISDGRGNLTHHPIGDPNLVKADEWQIHLYRCSGNPGRWGSISGKSAQEVLKELKRSQQFDLKFAKWGYGDESRAYSEPLCSFKPKGPIAVIRDKTLVAPFKDELAELLKFHDEYRELRDNLDKTFAMIEDNTLQSSTNPMSNVGSKIMDYYGNYREAGKQLGRLQNMFDNLETASLQKFDELFNELQNSLDNLEEKSNNLLSNPNQSASLNSSNSWQFSKSWPYNEGGAKTWTTNIKIEEKTVIIVFNRKIVGSKRDDFNITDKTRIEFTDYIPDLIKNYGFSPESLQGQHILYKEDDLQQIYGRYGVLFKTGTVRVNEGKYNEASIYFIKQADRDDFYNKIISVVKSF